MALLGSIIKSAINLSQTFGSDAVDAREAQSKVLINLLETAQNTSFGQYYGFSSILKAESPQIEFQQRVPIFDYKTMNNRWWSQQQKHPNITWPGQPDFFALSSGTTGKESKRIPVTTDMLNSIRKVGVSLVKDLPNYDLPPVVFEKEILMLSSTADLNEHNRGFREGEISGINVNNFPGWYDLFYRPGREIAQIDNWDQRLEKIVEEAPNWDIGSIAGIPSWVQLMLKAIIKGHNLKNIHEIWPNLHVYSSGGVAFGPYRESFNKLTERPLIIIDTYLASEGFFAYSAHPDSLSMKLATSHGVYFEFIPFDERGFDGQGNILEDPEVKTLDEIKENEEYALLISTCSGAWRYMIGDTIKVTDLEKMEIRITGRTKFFLNVVGSQLSEEKINAAIEGVSKDLGVTIDEFSVAAVKDEDSGEYYHQWILAADEKVDEEVAAKKLDEFLKDLNKNYRVARSKALKGIQVKSVLKPEFYGWLESKKKKGGQIKTPKVISEKKMRDFLGFLK